MARSGQSICRDKAGLGDGLVFLPHRIGDGKEIGLVARIMAVVKEQRDDPRRGGAEGRAGHNPIGVEAAI
jgi:hypothetical protein